MSQAVTLRVGSRLAYDGQILVLAELHADQALLRAAGGGARLVSLAQLAAAATVAGEPPAAAEPALGPVLDGLAEHDRATLAERVAHVRELLTGYASGSAQTALPGEPRPAYHPSLPLMARYEAKAQETGVGVVTVRRWVSAFRREGPAGLADGRWLRAASALGRVDARWLDAARAVVAEHTDASTPTKAILIDRATARVEAEHGAGVVPAPCSTVAYAVLGELMRGKGFGGSAKWRQSIATRPSGVYGRLRATRPGEYVLLDTYSLDVYAMEQVTHRWVQVQLSVAMDLFTRCVVGIRLTPVSTRAVDVARLLYDVVRPQPAPGHWPPGARWPYHGLPGAFVVEADQLERGGDARAGAGLAGPVLAPETFVVDHGKVYLSRHVESVCARLGISIQPARPYQGSDKAALERWFRTVRQDLLEALPGYKGPDVHSRGRAVEDDAFFFLHELDAIIREWAATVYHRRPGDGLAVPEAPGLELSPYEMYEYGVGRAGFVQIPAGPELAYDFLDVCWRRLHHYGVEVHRLRYNGPVLNPYRDTTSPYIGRCAGKWPIRVDPDDVRRVFFQDPADNRWHELAWEHAAAAGGPFSADALAYARRLAAEVDRFPDDRQALARLLERWRVGLVQTPEERRLALRQARSDAVVLPAPEPEVTDLASVRAVLRPVPGDPPDPGADPDGGDDDLDEELDTEFGGEPGEDASDEEFYADAMRGVE
jgi:transposase InsO family protein